MSDALQAFQVVALLLVALGAWAVVAARDPLRQAFVASLYGLTLGMLFFAFQAPDVALSNIVIGSVALPTMILLALAKTGDERAEPQPARAGAGEISFAARRRCSSSPAPASRAPDLGPGRDARLRRLHGSTGQLLNRVAVPSGSTTDVVTAVNFDYRGFDTLGEEFILFAAVLGLALLLREAQATSSRGPIDDDAPRARPPETSAALRLLTAGSGPVHGAARDLHHRPRAPAPPAAASRAGSSRPPRSCSSTSAASTWRCAGSAP